MKSLTLVIYGLAATALLAGGIGCSSGDEPGTIFGDGSGGSTVSSGGSANGGGSGGTTGGTASGGAQVGAGGSDQSGGATDAGGTGTDTGGNNAGGGGDSGGSSGSGGSGAVVDCSTADAVVTYPTWTGAPESPLYTVTAAGTKQFVEKMTDFGAEMQVHYAHFELASGCTEADVSVQVQGGFSNFTLSPKSKQIVANKSGDTITFTSGPAYLILKVDNKELLFILIDEPEVDPPHLGDDNVKSIADYDVDDTGATTETTKIQSAIDAAAGSAQNILYFPPGRYKTGEIMLKSDMTLYLAGGAFLDGSTNTSDYKAAGPAVENTTHGLVHIDNAQNVKILGRGVIDNNGSTIRAGGNDTPSFKINTLRIDRSSMITVDGIVSRDPVFWNTLIFDSDQVTIQNYKVINRRPTTTDYNQTDGVDFDCSKNSKLYNAFIYSGDDSMSPKREQEGTIDTNNITYEKVVAYSNSAAMKIGTKTYGQTIDTITFKDIDVVKAGRAMGINADDTAVIQNITWENIRIEGVDGRIIDFEEDATATWRNAPNMATVKDVYITDVASDVNKEIYIHGHSGSVNFNGIHFDNFTIGGNKVTSQSGWNVNQYVSGITFQ